MNTFLDCIPCFLRQTLDAARNVTDDPIVQERILREVLTMAADIDMHRPPPFMGQLIHRRIRTLTGMADPYQKAKCHFNRIAMDALLDLTDRAKASLDPLLVAAKCAVAANAIDMAVVAAISDADVQSALAAAPDHPLEGDWPRFVRAVAEAKTILYLTDNCGEIAVDRMLIEQLGPGRVTVAVRGSPVLNDATMEDAEAVGIDRMVEVIDNGSDAPGTILSDCSDVFLKRFEEADLVIAKGLGNYETLCDVERRMAFLFKVKCPLVSRHVNLPIGAFALLQR